MKNIEGLFSYSIHPKPSDNKTSSEFQKGGLKIGILKCQIPFSDHNRVERIQMDPIGLCFADSLRGIKHFQDFKTANFRL